MFTWISQKHWGEQKDSGNERDCIRSDLISDSIWVGDGQLLSLFRCHNFLEAHPQNNHPFHLRYQWLALSLRMCGILNYLTHCCPIPSWCSVSTDSRFIGTISDALDEGHTKYFMLGFLIIMILLNRMIFAPFNWWITLPGMWWRNIQTSFLLLENPTNIGTYTSLCDLCHVYATLLANWTCWAWLMVHRRENSCFSQLRECVPIIMKELDCSSQILVLASSLRLKDADLSLSPFRGIMHSFFAKDSILARSVLMTL